jgi:hypothetical protein
MTRTPLLVAALAILAASPASAGPPWIAIEYPANPHHPSTRGAALLVRAYHHSESLAVPVTGTAEGIVEGKRVSRKLDLRATNIPGVYALRSELPNGGTWVLAISVEQGKDATATALVTLNGKGRIAHVEVPSNRSGDGWTVPRAVKPADIERALQVAAAEDAGGDARRLGLAGVLGLPLLLALVVSRRRPAA